MLPKSKRLVKSEVERVLKNGRKFSSRFFLATATGRGVSRTAFSVIASKKIARNATLRNKLRRRVYNIIHPLMPQVKKSIHGVIVLKKGSERAKPGELSEDFKHLLSSMDLI